MDVTRVILADDHPVYRDGLAQAIAGRDDLEVVAEASDGRAAIAAIREHRPEVAVLDVKMPGLTGIEVAAEIAREEIPTGVLLLSATDDPAAIVEAVATGVSGYLLKDASRQVICDAIADVAAGRVVLSPEAQAAVAGGLRAQRRTEVISERERQILQLTAEGMSSARVGEVLHLSPATVKTHLRSIYEKLGVSERAAAVAVAMRMGLLE